jgi:alkylation response protein AidB-like acyl-CoA dehydrogenase
MASTHAARTAVDVTQAMFRLAGTTGIYVDHPLSRYVRDAMVVAQHAFLSESTLEGAGRILLGMEAQPGYP